MRARNSRIISPDAEEATRPALLSRVRIEDEDEDDDYSEYRTQIKVLEAFTAAHAAFPRFVRSASALDAVQLLAELLADDAAVRVAGRAPLARALVACAAGRAPSGALAAGGTHTLLRVRRLSGSENSLWVATAAYGAAAAVLVVPTIALAIPWLTELRRLFHAV